MSQASLEDKIGAYRTAISLSPELAGLQLNLAQLLFWAGAFDEAESLLKRSLRLGLADNDLLEVQIYRLAHTAHDIGKVLKEVKRLVQKGARVDWDVSADVDLAKKRNKDRGEFVQRVVHVCTGKLSLESI